MIDAKHYLNGTEIRPQNADEIGFKIDFSGEEGVTQNEITVDNVVLVNKACKLVKSHIESVGICQGIPYQIKIGGLVLDYYIDLTESPVIGDHHVDVKIKKRKSFEWFKKNADVLTFEVINKTHPFNLLSTKYVIERDDRGMIVITSLMASYSLALAIAEQTKSLAEAVGQMTAAVFPLFGASVGAGAGVVTIPVKPLDIAWAILNALLQLAFLLLTILAFINMVKTTLSVVFPRIRKFKSATVHELISKGCKKLGFQFQSSIITSSSAFTILPVPIVDDSKSVFEETLLPPIQSGYTKGYPTAVDTVPTLGLLLDAVLKQYNAKIYIENNIVKLERRDNWQLTSDRAVTNTLSVQDKREN